MIRAPLEPRAEAVSRLNEILATPQLGPIEPVHALLCGYGLPSVDVPSEEGTPPEWFDPGNASMWAAMAAENSGAESGT